MTVFLVFLVKFCQFKAKWRITRLGVERFLFLFRKFNSLVVLLITVVQYFSEDGYKIIEIS